MALCVLVRDMKDEGLKSELTHERLMRRLDRAEFEFDSGKYFDGGTILDALLDRYDA